MAQELKAAQKQLTELKTQLALAQSQALASQAVSLESGAKLLVHQMPGLDAKALQVRHSGAKLQPLSNQLTCAIHVHSLDARALQVCNSQNRTTQACECQSRVGLSL